ncbi:hypothetical protein, partial [Clostridioides difficile]|uniref:hypothetical protein n=1 Tax=Clostridioides difficile TaxID=1496 RepID=UPI0018DC4730
ISAGAAKGAITVELFVKNLFDERANLTRYAECTTSVCGHAIYIVPQAPRTIGIKFGHKF